MLESVPPGGLGPGYKSVSKILAHEVSGACHRVPGSVLGLSVCLSNYVFLRTVKPLGLGGGRNYLDGMGLFLRTFFPSLLQPSHPPPTSLLSLTHSFIQQKFRQSPLGPALGWAGPCLEFRMIQAGVCPWGAPGLVRKVA